MNRAIYPGSFDPITNGHLDIIERAARMFDEVHIVVMHNIRKKYTFPLEERIELIQKSLVGIPGNFVVSSYDGLLVDLCKSEDIYTVIRGLRALTDFDYEFQMAITNRQLEERVESVLLVSNIKYTYVSSSMVKEVAYYHGDVSDVVPSCVLSALKREFEY